MVHVKNVTSSNQEIETELYKNGFRTWDLVKDCYILQADVHELNQLFEIKKTLQEKKQIVLVTQIS